MLGNNVNGLLVSPVAALLLVALACGGEEEATPAAAEAPAAKVSAARAKQWDAPPPLTIDPSKNYTATIELEKGGEIVIDLYARRAPKTVNNFVFLAREGFYDRTTFYEVIYDLRARAGDPTGTGKGGPGYTFEDEFHPELRHFGQGVVSMANQGDPDTNGSQFSIVTQGAPFDPNGLQDGDTGSLYLDGLNDDGSPKNCADLQVECHSVFGVVSKGLSKIKLFVPTSNDPDGPVIKTIRIDESP